MRTHGACAISPQVERAKIGDVQSSSAESRRGADSRRGYRGNFSAREIQHRPHQQSVRGPQFVKNGVVVRTGDRQ